METAQLTVPIWEKAVLTVEEAAALTGIGRDVIRALAHHALHGPGDFPVFTVGKSLKIPRLSLLEWLSDAAACGRNLKRAEMTAEAARKLPAGGKRGRPRKVIGMSVIGGKR
jgi:excisionase family DNA binding protein